MGEFRRDQLPTPQAFFESCGLVLTGRGPLAHDKLPVPWGQRFHADHDYYPSPVAAAVINRLWSHRAGCDLSSVIN